MFDQWNCLADHEQLALSNAALARAVDTIAHQAETLAEEMETGTLADLGGPDALRLLAAVMRTATQTSRPVRCDA